MTPANTQFVLIIGNDGMCYRPFRKFGEFSRNQDLLNYPEKVSLVVFTGGVDISPSLYGHSPSKQTWCNPLRDVHELYAYRLARANGLPIVGICRGSQFLCAMAGGTLFQHVKGHNNGHHTIATTFGDMMPVTSTHHQMQNPPPGAKILAWAPARLSEIYIGEDDKEEDAPKMEYECVYYPNINALGLQYHPEMMQDHSKGFALAAELVDTCLNKNSGSIPEFPYEKG